MNEKKIILIVDDSRFDRTLAKSALTKLGEFSILEAGDGEECLRTLEKEKADLVLLDIVMPGTYGSEVLVKIREKYNPIALPVIMLTSMNDVADVVKCLHNGANDYLSKPVNFEIALSRIKTHLRVSDFSREMSRLGELAALEAMVATYNHEINNPLAIAISCLEAPEIKNAACREKLEKSLWRIVEIVKKTSAVTKSSEITYGDYSSNKKIIKI